MKKLGHGVLALTLGLMLCIPQKSDAGRTEDNIYFGLGGLAIGSAVGYVVGRETTRNRRVQRPVTYYDYYTPRYSYYTPSYFYQPTPAFINSAPRGQSVSLANTGFSLTNSGQQTAPEPAPQNITITIGDNASNVSINLGSNGEVLESSEPVSAGREGRQLRRPAPSVETENPSDSEENQDSDT